MLQEIKCQDDGFPRAWRSRTSATIAPCTDKKTSITASPSSRSGRSKTSGAAAPGLQGLPGAASTAGDDHARYIEAIVPGEKGPVRVASIYLPNGNPPDTDKYQYKLGWMDRLHARMEPGSVLLDEEPFASDGGDYNVIPTPDSDVWDAKAWMGDALYQPESRAALRRIEYLGLTDAFRACHAETNRYTFWDYQAGSWQKDHGIRIDHILLSPQAADRLKACGIDKHVRGWDKPSDHVPVWCELAI